MGVASTESMVSTVAATLTAVGPLAAIVSAICSASLLWWTFHRWRPKIARRYTFEKDIVPSGASYRNGYVCYIELIKNGDKPLVLEELRLTVEAGNGQEREARGFPAGGLSAPVDLPKAKKVAYKVVLPEGVVSLRRLRLITVSGKEYAFRVHRSESEKLREKMLGSAT